MTAIILVNWNGADDTIACLNSLLQLRGNFSVLVVDNGSGDDSVERIGQWIALHESSIAAELLPLDMNYGFAVGNIFAIGELIGNSCGLIVLVVDC